MSHEHCPHCGGELPVSSASIHIENISVRSRDGDTADEVAAKLHASIGWLGITGRREL